MRFMLIGVAYWFAMLKCFALPITLQKIFFINKHELYDQFWLCFISFFFSLQFRVFCEGDNILLDLER